ncbi:hypothetical protein MRS44_009333 [Fusarium solani]|uniref:uncharacterized protein n=1 Tax=Fusarium solani TaxID=169388 RepID=UPI0032C47520|nr:hypothetical protein MRS44_009333 [Fusarium solani]
MNDFHPVDSSFLPETDLRREIARLNGHQSIDKSACEFSIVVLGLETWQAYFVYRSKEIDLPRDLLGSCPSTRAHFSQDDLVNPHLHIVDLIAVSNRGHQPQ